MDTFLFCRASSAVITSVSFLLIISTFYSSKVKNLDNLMNSIYSDYLMFKNVQSIKKLYLSPGLVVLQAVVIELAVSVAVVWRVEGK